MASLVAQRVKNPPAMQETPGLISGPRWSAGEGNGNPLQYSCLENAMDRGTGGLQSMGSQRVRHNWATNTFTLGRSVVKNLPANAGNTGGSRYHLCVRKVPWRRKWQTHSSILAWKIPWTEEPGRLQSVQSQSQRLLSSHANGLIGYLCWNTIRHYFTPMPSLFR